MTSMTLICSFAPSYLFILIQRQCNFSVCVLSYNTRDIVSIALRLVFLYNMETGDKGLLKYKK